MTILGIDPGLASTGFGVISGGKSPSLVTCGHIKTSPGEHISGRLYQISSDLRSLVSGHSPDMVAIENVFSLVRYPRAGILLGGVLGVIYITARERGIPVLEITPKEIKNALAGYGGAGKDQIKAAVRRLLNTGPLKSSHASDALAVALTAYFRGGRRSR